MRLPLFLLIALSACITPRSMTLGMMGSAVGRGATEIGVMTGVVYASQTTPPSQTMAPNGDVMTSETTTRGFSLPAFEANLQHGFNEHVGINIHASSAGLQPGLKITVTKSKVIHFSILPSFGIGYGSLAGSTFVAGNDGRLTETNPTTTTHFDFLGGVRFIFSHEVGFYMGVGYDFLYSRYFQSALVGAQGSQDQAFQVQSAGQHQIMGAVGFNVTVGMLRIRPEVAVSVTPAITTTTATMIGANGNQGTVVGGFSWALMPGFTFAIATPAQARPADEDEGPVKENDGTTDDDDEPVRKSKRRSADEDEDGPRKSRKKPLDESEELIQ